MSSYVRVKSSACHGKNVVVSTMFDNLKQNKAVTNYNMESKNQSKKYSTMEASCEFMNGGEVSGV